MKALITTVPFGEINRLPYVLLEEAGIKYTVNPLGKRLTEVELADMVADFDVIIAGTEPITNNVMQKGKKLKMISRVGIGLDSVDLQAAEQHGIVVSFTPDAPAPAVSEFTIGLMLSLLRFIQVSNLNLHGGKWHRYLGKRLSECTLGVIGVGRIGRGVLRHLSGFECKKILANDIFINDSLEGLALVEWVEKETIYHNADIITLHVPLTTQTKNMIQRKQLAMMKSDAIIINTSRGGIINEQDLYAVMKDGHLAGAAIDVFQDEPYSGQLRNIERCLLTAHMGSMSEDCRVRMEVEATEEVVRFCGGIPLKNGIPEEEYKNQKEFS